MRRPSLKDVAREAQVSYQTVSRVLKGEGRYADATKERVRETAARLGYLPNSAARALVTRRTRLIGVIADGSPRYGPVSTLVAVQAAARDADYETLIATVYNPSQEEAQTIVDDFLRHGVEGIIVVAPRVPTAQISRLGKLPVPAVILAPGEINREGFTVFSEDQELGARLATEHLIGLGHRRIMHLAGSQEWLDGQVRLRGWRAALDAASLSALPVRYGDWTGVSAYVIGQALVESGALPDAVFVASDLMALAFIRALYEAGVRVPDDISIVGFDDNEFADQMFPPLTTVRQSFDLVGRRCMEILLGLIKGEEVDTTPATPQLIVRSSTALRTV
ncbi:MAG: LacI family DNA-binding transcriptional regulator [Propionibacteriaceae bacterium]|nr:LacI family DNA-binding transcriptional regulator [Propionibacteriaceae bacterium]